MSKQKKENKIWTLLAPVVVLVSICLVITAALAGTNAVTQPIIDAASQKAADAALIVVLPSGEGFEEMALEGLPEGVTAASKAGNGAGYVFTISTKGYTGGLVVMVGLDDKGAVSGVKVLASEETAGIGSEVIKDGSTFMAQLPGVTDVGDIQSVSGATMTSVGMKGAIQSAFDAYTIANGGKVEAKLSTKPATLTDKVIEKYLPGATLTEVEGGQVSDTGLIVYGEAQGAYSVIHVAVFFDNDKNILGVCADTLSETEYIGDVIGQNEDFMGKFIGAADINSIETVSGATITSGAVKDAVKMAIANFDTVKGAA